MSIYFKLFSSFLFVQILAFTNAQREFISYIKYTSEKTGFFQDDTTQFCKNSTEELFCTSNKKVDPDDATSHPMMTTYYKEGDKYFSCSNINIGENEDVDSLSNNEVYLDCNMPYAFSRFSLYHDLGIATYNKDHSYTFDVDTYGTFRAFFPSVYREKEELSCYIQSYNMTNHSLTIVVPHEFKNEEENNTTQFKLMTAPQNTETDNYKIGTLNFTWPTWNQPGDPNGVCVSYSFNDSFIFIPHVQASIIMNPTDTNTPINVWVESVTQHSIKVCASVDDEKAAEAFSGLDGAFYFVAFINDIRDVENDYHFYHNKLVWDIKDTLKYFPRIQEVIDSNPTTFRSFHGFLMENKTFEISNDNITLEFDISLYPSRIDPNDWRNLHTQIQSFTHSNNQSYKELYSQIFDWFRDFGVFISSLCDTLPYGTYNYFCESFKNNYRANSHNSRMSLHPCEINEIYMGEHCYCRNGMRRDEETGLCIEECGRGMYTYHDECYECLEGTHYDEDTMTCVCDEAGYRMDKAINGTCIPWPHNYSKGVVDTPVPSSSPPSDISGFVCRHGMDYDSENDVCVCNEHYPYYDDIYDECNEAPYFRYQDGKPIEFCTGGLRNSFDRFPCFPTDPNGEKKYVVETHEFVEDCSQHGLYTYSTFCGEKCYAPYIFSYEGICHPFCPTTEFAYLLDNICRPKCNENEYFDAETLTCVSSCQPNQFIYNYRTCYQTCPLQTIPNTQTHTCTDVQYFHSNLTFTQQCITPLPDFTYTTCHTENNTLTAYYSPSNYSQFPTTFGVPSQPQNYTCPTQHFNDYICTTTQPSKPKQQTYISHLYLNQNSITHTVKDFYDSSLITIIIIVAVIIVIIAAIAGIYMYVKKGKKKTLQD